MAVEQGICKNCGSLVIFSTGDETCECIFCNAVFPRSELIPIDAELKDIVFPNEKFEKTGTSNKHQYSVMPDQVTPVVQREKTTGRSSSSSETSKFEIAPKDVKAPKKAVIAICAATAAFLVVVAGISVPLYSMRTKLTDKMENKMSSVVEGVAQVDTSRNEKGVSAGYSIQGLNCQYVSIVTDDKITEDTAKQLFANYSEARKSITKSSSDKDITMKIYADGGVYNVKSTGATYREDIKATSSKK